MLVIKVFVTMIGALGYSTLSLLCVELTKPLSDKQINSRHRNYVIQK